ncbi:MAG: N-acetyltransferase, partial [Ignavibacteriaceae bacterium]|nr:N-acetyltransferase [Ignavibacteriaceae bacterium]
MENIVIHSAAEQIFYIDIEGQQATLKYFIEGENIMDIRSTYVPFSLRGGGLAAMLVEECLMFAEKNNYKIIPSCSYVHTFITRHPKYKKLVAGE